MEQVLYFLFYLNPWLINKDVFCFISLLDQFKDIFNMEQVLCFMFYPYPSGKIRKTKQYISHGTLTCFTFYLNQDIMLVKVLNRLG